MEEEINIPDPQLIPEHYETPTNQNALMILRLIKNKLESTLLPDNVKSHIMNDMNELVNNSSMTNISVGQIQEFLGDFDYIWMTYETFVNRKFRKELNYIKPSIRTIYKQNLNKSKDGFYPSLVFEQRFRYDIKQQRESPEEKTRRIWGKGKPGKNNKEEVEYR